HVAAAAQELRKMHTVTLAAGETCDALLLIGALEVEPRDVLARVHLALAELERVVAAADLLPHGVGRIEVAARLIDVRELHGVADTKRAAVRRLFARDHPEERRLARTVRPDHAHDPGRGQRESQILDEQPVAEALLHALRVDHQVAETRPRRDVDLDLVEPPALLLVEPLL